MKAHNCQKLFGLYINELSNTVTMKYIGRSLKFNRIVYRKYTKKYKFNIKILTFLKSNYKYKRRCLRKTLTDKMSVQRISSHRRLIRNNNKMQKQPLPVEEDMLKNNKNIMQRIPIYDNTKLDKFLKIFILIMQQAQLTATTINDDTRKNASNGLATRLVAKTKAIKNTNRSSSSSSTSNVNEDEINRNHRAYKDANKDTDNNIDIGSNIVDEISHQQHNYDKVSTITSTPIKCQRRKHLQLNATKISATTLSPSSPSPSVPLASPMTMTTSLSSPSVVVQTNYETYQWSAILRNCACDSPPIHHQYQYHHYHHRKRKHIQQHHHFYQQHQQQQHQWQQHAVHIKSLTSRSLLSDNNNNNNSNKSDNSSIKNNNRSHNSNTIDSPTSSAISVYQTFDQYVNVTWNRSYTISCLLLTLFIAFTIGIRSTSAGACWQTVLDNGKCNEIFSLNISKSECCGANQEFAYTEREPTNVEYFFATAIGGGMECSPCLESCRNVKCGPNKKCVKRKGRPKCICAPECGAARRRRKQREHSIEQEQHGHQHHSDEFTSISKSVGDVDNEDDDVSSATVVQSSNGFNIKIEKSQQSRDIRSLSSEITNVNLGLKDGKHVIMFNSGGATSQMERHHSNNKEHNQNQRKLIHVHLNEHPYSQQQQQEQRQQQQQKSKKSINLQQYTHHMQQHQQEDQLRLQLEQQQTRRKDQEPKGSRRLLITANVEHTEKPTTRRLQIFSNVRTTHARRRNSNSNKNNTNNSNSNRNNNKKKNKSDQHEDTDPSDTDIDDKVVENDEDYNYNDAEDNEDNIETKMKYRSSNGNSNRNSNNNNNNKNNINRNDDATRFLNQSLSRHKLTTNIRVNNKNSNSNSSSHSHSQSNSKSSDNNSKNNERKTKRRKNHDLQKTEILQHHSSDNNTRIRYPQQNQSHTVDISHHRHNRHHHRQQQRRKHNHHRQDFQNHNHHKKHHQQQNHHRRHHGRQKFNTHHTQQQTIGTKEPKNDKDYNATITVVSPIPITITPADTTKIEPLTTVLQSQVATSLMNLSSSSSSSLSSALENSTSVIIVTTTTPNQQIQPSRSQLLLSSSAMSSLSAATPVNSTLSALNSGAAAVDAADDFYHSHSKNHGSKIATSSSQSPSSTSSSYSQPSVSVFASSESVFLPSVSAKGEGVSRHDHQHRRIQILTSNNNKHNNNNNDNDDHKITALNSNLHNNPQQQEEQNEQQHDQQPQAHQQYFHSTLFDAISDQIDFMGFSTKQQTITDAEFDRPLNPVCGTDGRTYNTECQLRKRACRTDNPNLQIAYRGHCRTTCNGVKCLNGLTCIEDQYSMPHCIACKIECPQDDCDNDVVDATKAVCGADGKTYKSVCDINRMICKIGRSIGVAYPGPCRVEQITCDDINCGPKQVCLIDWLTHTPRCTSCRYKCSRKRRPSFPPFEEGKICGVNNRTYNSWCEMRKDSCSTGFYIDLKYSGDCH